MRCGDLAAQADHRHCLLGRSSAGHGVGRGRSAWRRRAGNASRSACDDRRPVRCRRLRRDRRRASRAWRRTAGRCDCGLPGGAAGSSASARRSDGRRRRRGAAAATGRVRRREGGRLRLARGARSRHPPALDSATARLPTASMSPRLAVQRERRVPATGEGISTVALSVITSTSAWSSATVSPTADVPLDDLGLGDAFADVGQLDDVNVAHADQASITRGTPRRRGRARGSTSTRARADTACPSR